MSDIITVVDKEISLEDLCTVLGVPAKFFEGTQVNAKLQGTFDARLYGELVDSTISEEKIYFKPTYGGFDVELSFVINEKAFEKKFKMSSKEILGQFSSDSSYYFSKDWGMAEGFHLSFQDGNSIDFGDNVQVFNDAMLLLEVGVKILSKDESLSKRISNIFTSELYMDVVKSDGEFQEFCQSQIDNQLRETKINSLGGYMPKNVCKFVKDNILKSDKAYDLPDFNRTVSDPNSNIVVYITNKLLEEQKSDLNDKSLAKELLNYKTPHVDRKAVYKFLTAHYDRVKEMVKEVVGK